MMLGYFSNTYLSSGENSELTKIWRYISICKRRIHEEYMKKHLSGGKGCYTIREKSR